MKRIFYLSGTLFFLSLTVLSPGTVLAQTGPPFLFQWEVDRPVDIDVDANGNVYVASEFGPFPGIKKFSADGTFIEDIPTNGRRIRSLDVTTDGTIYAVANISSAEILIIPPGGSPNTLLPFDIGLIHAIAADGLGSFYITIGSNRNRVEKYDDAGNLLFWWGARGSFPGWFEGIQRLAVDTFGNVYVVDNGNQRIQVFQSNGHFLFEFGESGSSPGQLESPIEVFVDESGYIYVSDNALHAISVFTSSGSFVERWGNIGSAEGLFSSPHGVTVGPSGAIYVAGGDNDRVQVFAGIQLAVPTRKTTWGRIKTLYGSEGDTE